MQQTLRFVFGILGNAASLLLYAAPMFTFKRVVKKQSTEEFSCIPYVLALLNCLLYTWYGLPVVSSGWENFPLITINGLGILFEASFICIYIWFSPPERRKLVSLMLVPVAILFIMIAPVSSFALQDHHHRKVFVGSIGLVASIAMYGSPLVVVKRVIKTKSVEYMPFYLSLFSCMASTLWMVYGLLGHDLFLTAPNLLGCPMGIFQLILYCIYKGNKAATEEPDKMDLEKHGVYFESQKQVVNGKN